MSLLGEKRRRNMMDLVPDPLRVVPSSGLLGLVVTVQGAGLSAVTGVQVGGMQSLLVVVINDTSLTALVPTLGPGSKTVILQSPNGDVEVPGGYTVTLI